MGSPQRQTVKTKMASFLLIAKFFETCLSATPSITEWTLFLKEKILKLWLPYK